MTIYELVTEKVRTITNRPFVKVYGVRLYMQIYIDVDKIKH